jgi:hypothetical protein
MFFNNRWSYPDTKMIILNCKQTVHSIFIYETVFAECLAMK